MRLARAARLALSLAALLPAATLAQLPVPQPAPAPAQPSAPPTGKILKETWDAAYLDGHRAGYVHLKVEEFTTSNGAKINRSTQEMSIRVRRGAQVAAIDVVSGTDEMPDGKVLGVFMTQALAKQVQQTVIGKVQGNQLQLNAAGQTNFNKMVPWDDRVLGAAAEADLLRKRNPKPKPGEKFDYYTFQPLINRVVPVHVAVEAIEPVQIRTVNGVEKPNLLRVSCTTDEISDVTMPTQFLWFDGNYELRRSMAQLPGIGFLVLEKSTKDAVMQPVPFEQLVDIMDRQSIKVSRRLDNPHGRSEIVYRITVEDKDPAKTFAQDDRQSVANVQGKSFDMAVKAVRVPLAQAPADAAVPGPEFTSSNYFLTSDDPLVKQHAKTAVGSETDPWRKALAIERWVKANMKPMNFSEAMAPASHVAKTLEGDCSEFSMLTAAMCRAAGVPSRTAIGLVYVDNPPPAQAIFGFHMWTEVWVRGSWVALDATLGQGGVGPGHLKIADANWHDQRAMTPLLPLMRVIVAKPSIEPISVK